MKEETNHLIEVYTDGSSRIDVKNKYYESSSGCVIFLDGKEICQIGLFHNNGTTSLGEVYAIYTALYKVRDIINTHKELTGTPVYIFADSDYVVTSLTRYIKGWVRQGLDRTWISHTSNKEVAYQSIFKNIYKNFLLRNPYNIRIFQIHSHIAKTKNTKELNKARFAFMKRNEVEISLDEFRIHSDRNDIVDQLADHIRKNKIYFMETGDESWVSIRKNLTRNGCLIVRPRIANKN